MSKIAVLDTGICPKGLGCKAFRSYRICRNEKPSAKEDSHGTLCARALDWLAKDYELISIQVLPNRREQHKKPLGRIEDLRDGLALCQELEADVVCLSAVSSLLSDSRQLYEVTKRLSRQSVILAALDNRRFLTIPTAYPFVLGVQSDCGNLLMPGKLAYRSDDVFFANVYANCNIPLLKQLRCAPSNSFAVPVAAARVNDWVNQKADVWKAVRRLDPYPSGDKGGFYLAESGQEFSREIPLVMMHGEDDRLVYSVCQAVMEDLYAGYQVQTCCLTNLEGEYDVRFRKFSSMDQIRQELGFMEVHYKTDLMFFAIGERESKEAKKLADADIVVAVSGNGAEMAYEDACTVCSLEELAEQIYLALQP